LVQWIKVDIRCCSMSRYTTMVHHRLIWMQFINHWNTTKQSYLNNSASKDYKRPKRNSPSPCVAPSLRVLRYVPISNTVPQHHGFLIKSRAFRLLQGHKDRDGHGQSCASVVDRAWNDTQRALRRTRTTQAVNIVLQDRYGSRLRYPIPRRFVSQQLPVQCPSCV
jgi:hypothetical protein